jgi:hypothetical protein
MCAETLVSKVLLTVAVLALAPWQIGTFLIAIALPKEAKITVPVADLCVFANK